jgi:pimeloyl-ACP methyl ester carboxylesterase
MHINVEGGQVFVATGAETHQAGRPCILFIHGAGADHTAWVLFARFFSRNGFNVMAPDLPGHGQSGGAPLTSVEQLAQWAVRLLDAAPVRSAVVVGHSLGSLVALEAAAQAPERFTRAVLLGASAPMPVGEALLNAARERSHAAVDMIMQYGHAFISQLGGNPVAGISVVNSNMRILERGLARNLFEDLNACHTYQGGIDAARRIRIPVTLILGEQDRMTPPRAARPLIAALAVPDVRMVPDCGHMLMSEQPESVHRALVAAVAGR